MPALLGRSVITLLRGGARIARAKRTTC